MSNGGEKSSVEKPLVYNYLNFREFLDHMVLFLRAQKKYSSRSFAEKVGFSSPSYLKMIIDGKRNLTIENCRKLASAFELDSEESRFFERLVNFCQVEHSDIKASLFEELSLFKKFREIHVLARAEYDFYNSWAQPVLYEMIGFVEVEKRKAEVAESLKISVSELDAALSSLKLLGLIKQKQGRWVKTNIAIRTTHETANLNVKNFHKAMIRKALERLDELTSERRDYQALTLALSKKDFLALKEMVYEFLNKANQRYSGTLKPHQIYQLNMQLFPLADIILDESSD